MLFTNKAHGNFAKDPAVVKFHEKSGKSGVCPEG